MTHPDLGISLEESRAEPGWEVSSCDLLPRTFWRASVVDDRPRELVDGTPGATSWFTRPRRWWLSRRPDTHAGWRRPSPGALVPVDAVEVWATLSALYLGTDTETGSPGPPRP